VGAHDKMDLVQTKVGAVIGVWFGKLYTLWGW